MTGQLFFVEGVIRAAKHVLDYVDHQKIPEDASVRFSQLGDAIALLEFSQKDSDYDRIKEPNVAEYTLKKIGQTPTKIFNDGSPAYIMLLGIVSLANEITEKQTMPTNTKTME